MNDPLPFDLPLRFGDEHFAIHAIVDREHGGRLLYGRMWYSVGEGVLGDPQSRTSLLDTYLGMDWIIRGAGLRRNERFEDLSSDAAFDLYWRTRYGSEPTGFEEIANAEAWVKHELSMMTPSFRVTAVLQFDGENASRLLWRDCRGAGGDISPVGEAIIPIGSVEAAFNAFDAFLEEAIGREKGFQEF